MKQDYIEILSKLKSEMVPEIDETIIDINTEIENLNPYIDEENRFKNNSKIIFKEFITEESAKELLDLVTNIKKYSTNELWNYKEDILNKCNKLYIQGENPIEMLVYSIKGLNNNLIYINSIKDVIKTIYEDNSEMVEAGYSNILRSWTWNECIEVVLQSIKEIRIYTLANDIYHVFKTNDKNRTLAANTIVSLEKTDLYESIMNFLTTQEELNAKQLDEMRNILYYMAKYNDSNTFYIYKYFLQLSFNKDIQNIFIGAIRFNFNNIIVEDIQKNLKVKNLNNRVFNKTITLLSRSKNTNSKISGVLKELVKMNHLDQNQRQMINKAIGRDDENRQINIIANKNKSDRERIDSIISLSSKPKDDCSSEKDTKYLRLLDEVENESELLKVVVTSVKAERGNTGKVIDLFKYIVNGDEYDEVSIEAVNQVKKLKTVGSDDIKNSLLKVAHKLLENDALDNIKKVNIILDIFSVGRPTDEIGVMFLQKLKTTKHKSVKIKIIQFYKKEFNKFKSKKLMDDIKSEIVKATTERAISKEAMECLRAITVDKMSAPSLGGNR